jgi:hypothetical protein
VASLHSLGEALETRVSHIDTQAWNQLVVDTTRTSEVVREQVADVGQRADEVLSRANALLGDATSTVSALRPDDLTRTLEGIDATVATIQQSAIRWPQTVDQLDATLRSLQATFRVAIGVLLLLGIVLLGAVARGVMGWKRRVAPARE